MEEWVITTAITLGIGIITYFLKRTMNQVDEQEKEICKIRDNYTQKDQHQKDFDECREDIKRIRSEYLMKEDFLREIGNMNKKLDRMMDLIIEKFQNGGKV